MLKVFDYDTGVNGLNGHDPLGSAGVQDIPHHHHRTSSITSPRPRISTPNQAHRIAPHLTPRSTLAPAIFTPYCSMFFSDEETVNYCDEETCESSVSTWAMPDRRVCNSTVWLAVSEGSSTTALTSATRHGCMRQHHHHTP